MVLQIPTQMQTDFAKHRSHSGACQMEIKVWHCQTIRGKHDQILIHFCIASEGRCRVYVLMNGQSGEIGTHMGCFRMV